MSTDETAQTAMDRMRRAMEKAAREFEPFGRPDTDFFKNALRYPDPAVRSLAVTVLCRVQDTRAINLLIEAMQDAGDETAARIVEEFGKSTTEQSAAVLIKALRDINPTIRTRAAIALGQKGRPEAVEPLIGLLGYSAAQTSPTSGNRGETFIADGQSGERWNFSEPTALTTPYEVREAARLLGKLKDRRAVAPLIQILRAHGPENNKRDILLQVRAVTSLGEIGDRRAVEAVIGAISDGDKDIRHAAAIAAENLAGFRAEPEVSRQVLIVILTLVGDLFTQDRDIHRDIRSHAVRTLNALGDARALPFLAGALLIYHDLRSLLPEKAAILAPMNVWNQFLLDQTIDVSNRVEILIALHRIRSGHSGPRLLRLAGQTDQYILWAESYARQHLADEEPNARKCAQEMIDYLSLVRGSQRNDGAEDGLLRAASGSGTEANAFLLKGASPLLPADTPSRSRRSWWARLLAFFHR